jgi:crotonobetainyl-CoA:carnitine CoA-transferase CaiB-like acyl-CoA transferase
MADWGAEVIKIEPLSGDPYRANTATGKMMSGTSSHFHYANRGKRSIALDLKSAGGREIVHNLVRGADVLVTNLRLLPLRKLGMDYDTVSSVNRRLVYTLITGYGKTGPEANTAAFDTGAFWARGGIADTLLPSGAPPVFSAGAIGDCIAGLAAAAGTCAALLTRQTSGTGQLVDTSLFRAAAYFGGLNLFDIMIGEARPRVDRNCVPNPLANCYRDARGRWFFLMNLQADRAWPGVLRAIGREDLTNDARFDSLEKRASNATELVNLLDGAFARRTLFEWEIIFKREDIWYCPVQTQEEVIGDPQAEDAGLFMNVPADDPRFRMPAGPVDFCAMPGLIKRRPPELGEHTEEILLKAGYTWSDIALLKSKGSII